MGEIDEWERRKTILLGVKGRFHIMNRKQFFRRLAGLVLSLLIYEVLDAKYNLDKVFDPAVTLILKVFFLFLLVFVPIDFCVRWRKIEKDRKGGF